MTSRGPRTKTCRLLLAAFVALAVAGGAPSPAQHMDLTGDVIVFVSDRDSPSASGEIYSLAAGRAPVNVSRNPGYDGNLLVAPDGQLIAFSSNRSGTPRLYLSRADGSGLRLLPVPLLSVDDAATLVAFSPDGSRLLATVTNATGTCRAFLVTVASLRTSRLGDGCTPSWSPDGSRIIARIGRRLVAYDAAGHRRFSVPGFAALWSSRGRLAVVNAAGTSTVVVDVHGSLLAHLAGTAAAWSADGARLLLTRPGALLLADPATPTRARMLVRGPATWTPYGVALTPDGAFVRYQRPSGALVAAPLAGGAEHPLPAYGVWARDGRYAFTRPLRAAHPGGLPRLEVEIGDRFGQHAHAAGIFAADDHGASVLTWSANGRRLLYETAFRAPRGLWAINADGSNLHRVTPLGGPDAYAPAWSADSTHLAYASGSFSGGLCGWCNTSVVIATPDGHLQSTIPGANPSPASSDSNPSWAPSGTQLAVSVCCSGELDIVNTDGSARHTLAPGPAGDFASLAVWSPDNATIAYANADGINLIAPDGTNRHLLPKTTAAQATGLTWSPDSKLLAYSAADGIHLIPIDGSQPPSLVVAAHSTGGLSFSPDGSRLVYTAAGDLFVTPLQGGPARSLAPSPYNDTAPAWQP